MITYRATPLSADAYVLGEGPVWDESRRRLLWVDIIPGKVFAGRLDPFAIEQTWSFDGMVGAVAVAAEGALLVAEQETLTRVDPDGTRTPLARVLPAGGGSRLNDGAVDPDGRFLIGSMSLIDVTGATDERLARFEGGKLSTLDHDLTLSNGLAWVGDRCYSIDSVPGVVYGRDYPDGPREELFRVTGGLPDGMCADREGNLWIAVHGGGRVERRTPAGGLLAVVELDSPQPTSVAFAGPDLDVLVITSAAEGLDPVPPNAGRIYACRVDTAGLPTPYWNPAL
ncbi:SMP-30/gluconolactonase/LRE family protein [Actinoplanes sp. KI2]|uniref:SMP-30/gluconolactonase/LRE family protein n=1 Tax=Actinoplanes sp. KI2 TaxID=2983315 RepID=UPI0021D593BC|nr:SMP-30/gluconolactonase/LRE family protein [Actinoplanes sp. KI2]MCU7726892.1 SMP-30/gluconolactonase/LRE family protein [Actinoplanes sp. KI2]